MGLDPADAGTAHVSPALLRPTALAEAVAALDHLGADGAPLAGATWVMRAPHRREPFAATYVSLLDLPELRGVETGERASLGALLTHDDLARLDAGCGPLGALAQAAAQSAFPAVRAVATLGGNICARGFPESDLIPALLALDAELELAGVAGVTTPRLDAYLDERPPGIVTRVRVPAPTGRRSAFARLSVRASGEYPLCAVAVAVTLEGGLIRNARVAVGAVEDRARLLPDTADALDGVDPLDERALLAAGSAGAARLAARDGLDAPGWYRQAVLPALLRDALAAVARGEVTT